MVDTFKAPSIHNRFRFKTQKFVSAVLFNCPANYN